MEALTAGLVATEEELGLGAGLHRPLDPVAVVVVLVAHHVQQEGLLGLDEPVELLGELECGEKMLDRARGVGRVAGKQRRDHVHAPAARHPVGAYLEAGDRGVREDRPHAVGQEVGGPVVFRKIVERQEPPVG